MTLHRGEKPQAGGGSHASQSNFNNRQELVDVQPLDVRPLSFSFQHGISQYRINFRTRGDYRENGITRDPQQYNHIDSILKRQKRVRFRDPLTTTERKPPRSISQIHANSRPQAPVENVVIQVARMIQNMNKKPRKDEGGYRDWVPIRDKRVAQHEQDSQWNCSHYDNISESEPRTNRLPLERKRETESRLCSGNGGHFLFPRPAPIRYYPDKSGKYQHHFSPRPTSMRHYPTELRKHVHLPSPRSVPVRSYPKGDPSEAVRGGKQFLSPLEPVSSHSHSQASPLSRYSTGFRPSKLNQKQPLNVENPAPINPAPPLTRRKTRKRLTKLQML